MTEFVFEAYFDGGDKPVTRRFIITKYCYDFLHSVCGPRYLHENWFNSVFLHLTSGGRVALDMRDYSGFAVYVRTKSEENPLNSNEYYEDPTK
jgi:hypothetical protein